MVAAPASTPVTRPEPDTVATRRAELCQVMVRPDGIDLTLKLTSDMRIGIEGPSAQARTLLREGDARFCKSCGNRLVA